MDISSFATLIYMSVMFSKSSVYIDSVESSKVACEFVREYDAKEDEK